MITALAYVYSTLRRVENINDVERLIFDAQGLRGADYTVVRVECIKAKHRWMCEDYAKRYVPEFEIYCSDYAPGFVYTDSCILTILKPETSEYSYQAFYSGIDAIQPPDFEGERVERVSLRQIERLHFDASKQTITRRDRSFAQMMPNNGNEVTLSVMDCSNVGTVGGEITWSCSSPEMRRNYRLRGVSVICEGWDYPDDDFVVAGSCRVVYYAVKI